MNIRAVDSWGPLGAWQPHTQTLIEKDVQRL
jgi:hypothetical protein